MGDQKKKKAPRGCGAKIPRARFQTGETGFFFFFRNPGAGARISKKKKKKRGPQRGPEFMVGAETRQGVPDSQWGARGPKYRGGQSFRATDGGAQGEGGGGF